MEPAPTPPPHEPTTARLNRAEWAKYAFAGFITVAVTFFGFLGNRVANSIDKTDSAVQELRETVAVIRSYSNSIQTTLTDHEARLRTDRDTLVSYGVRLSEDELRIIASEQRAATSIPRR